MDVRLQFAAARRRLEASDAALTQSMRLRLSRAGSRLGPLEAHLKQLSPLTILDRGYAIVEREGKIVKSSGTRAGGVRDQGKTCERWPRRPSHAPRAQL